MRAWLVVPILLAACATTGAGVDGGRDAGAAQDGARARDTSGSDDATPSDAAGAEAGADAGLPTRTFVYVGLATGDLVTLDGATLRELARARTGDFPSFVAASADGAHLYVVHESADEVASIDVARDGTTTVTERQPALGGPTHVALDPAGQHVFVASYGSGRVSVYALDGSGALSRPASSDAVTCAHAHQVVPSAAGDVLYVPCLGDDTVVVRRIGAGGLLTPASVASTAAGAGPRHLALSRDGRFAYVIDELGSAIDVFAVGVDGALASVETVPTLPTGFTGTNACAEVLVSRDDRFVYGSNRGHESVVVFARDPSSGRLTLVEHEPAGGMHPRSMALSRDGAHLYVADRDSDVLVVLDVASDGRLSLARTLRVAGRPYFVGEFLAPR